MVRFGLLTFDLSLSTGLAGGLAMPLPWASPAVEVGWDANGLDTAVDGYINLYSDLI